MLKHLIEMIFGKKGEIPKHPKMFAREAPSKHWGSKRKFNKKRARRKDKRAKASRKRNRSK